MTLKELLNELYGERICVLHMIHRKLFLLLYMICRVRFTGTTNSRIEKQPHWAKLDHLDGHQKRFSGILITYNSSPCYCFGARVEGSIANAMRRVAKANVKRSSSVNGLSITLILFRSCMPRTSSLDKDTTRISIFSGQVQHLVVSQMLSKTLHLMTLSEIQFGKTTTFTCGR